MATTDFNAESDAESHADFTPSAKPDTSTILEAGFQAGMSIAACLAKSPLDALDTRILLMHTLALSRVQLITKSEQQLSATEAEVFSCLVQRRLAGEPVAYLTGEREFFGLDFKVTPDVLIPRPDTELLVELAIKFCPANARVLDLGTGSGAIAISLAYQRADLHLLALDISSAALTVAEHNAKKLLTSNHVQFLQSNWYSALDATHQAHQFACILSNPPYIVKDDPHLAALSYEPIDALTDHSDGLSAYRTIIEGARIHLADEGWILMEHGYDQAEAVQALLQQAGFKEIQSWPDLAGILRVTGARK